MPNRADERFASTMDRQRRIRRIRRNAGRHPAGQHLRRDIYRNLSRRAEESGPSETL